MRAIILFAVETLGLMLLAAAMLVAAIVAANQIGDEKIRYFVLGYYVALHHGLVLWVWKKLRVNKDVATDRQTPGAAVGRPPETRQ